MKTVQGRQCETAEQLREAMTRSVEVQIADKHMRRSDKSYILHSLTVAQLRDVLSFIRCPWTRP